MVGHGLKINQYPMLLCGGVSSGRKCRDSIMKADCKEHVPMPRDRGLAGLTTTGTQHDRLALGIDPLSPATTTT